MDPTSETRAVASGGAARAVAYVVGTLLSALSAALVLRHLGPDDYGAYAAAFALAAFALQVAEEGSASYAVRELARGDVGLRAVLRLRAALALTAVTAAVAVAALAGFDVAGTTLAGTAAVVTVIAMTAAVRWRVAMDLKRVAALELARAALVAAALAIAVLVGAGVTGLLAAALPAALGLLVVAYALGGRADGEGRAHLRGTLAVTAATATAAAYAAASVPLVAVTMSDADAGEYGAAFRLFFVVAGVPGLVASGALPLLARGWRPAGVTRTALLAGALLALATAATASLVVAVLAGPDFDGATTPLRVLALALPGTAVAAVTTQHLLAAGRTTPLVLAHATALAVIAAGIAAVDSATAAALVLTLTETALGAGLALLARPLRSHGPQPAP